MALDFDNLMQDFQVAMDDVPETLIYKTNTYSCVASDATEGENLEFGGFVNTGDLQLFCKVAEFPTLPEANEPITFKGKNLWIKSVVKAPDGKRFHMMLTGNK